MIPRTPRRGALAFLLFVVFTVFIIVYRSRFLFGLLIESGARYAIPDIDFADNTNSATPQLIPKIIHQTYKTDAIPKHWQAGQQAVKDLHPDYEYMFWTDKTGHEFIELHYPSFVSTYTSYTHPIQRADALRYHLLHHYGGIYLDLDISPYHSLTPLLYHPSFACRTDPTGISNDFLGSIPQHPFYAHVISRLEAYNRNWLVPYITVMYSTGPLFFSVMWIEYLHGLGGAEGHAMDRVRVLMKTEKWSDSYGLFKNVQGGSWHGRDLEVIFWMERHWIVVTVLGFVIAISVVGLLWWGIRTFAGFWRRELWWERERNWELVQLD